jgi:tRNA modification GTPase
MSEHQRDTIFALSSGRPPVAIAVIRISGPRAAAALTALGVKIPEPRKAGLARIRDPRSGEIIDEALVLWFPGPHSETGEDVAELQAHGGRAVIEAILDALGRVEGQRRAEAGEFTRRGFENGKLDLTAVEGLADLVGAETEAQRRQAFRQMKGLLGNRAEIWRRDLTKALALVEARIDFSDEADVPEDLLTPALETARKLRDEIAAVLADGGRGERLREGLVVAIAGPPNAGKSTLLNRLARREAAIVSPYAGTTRDVIEVHLDLGGLPVTLLDTAGIRDTDDPVELEGVRRARARAAAADLVLWVVDASAPDLPDGQIGAEFGIPGSPGAPGAPAGVSGLGGGLPISPEKQAVGMVAGGLLGGGGLLPDGAGRDPAYSDPAGSAPPPVWLIRNKIDLVEQTVDRNEAEVASSHRNEPRNEINTLLKDKDNNALIDAAVRSGLVFSLSAASGDGFGTLVFELGAAADRFLTGAEQAVVTRARHRRALEQTIAALDRALMTNGLGEDLLAEDLRFAASSLGRLTGRVDVEDILDVIFRDFCIGK